MAFGSNIYQANHTAEDLPKYPQQTTNNIYSTSLQFDDKFAKTVVPCNRSTRLSEAFNKRQTHKLFYVLVNKSIAEIVGTIQ